MSGEGVEMEGEETSFVLGCCGCGGGGGGGGGDVGGI